jgi:hypothetical protein
MAGAGPLPSFSFCRQTLPTSAYIIGKAQGALRQVVPLYQETMEILGTFVDKEHPAFLQAQHNLELVQQCVNLPPAPPRSPQPTRLICVPSGPHIVVWQTGAMLLSA